MTNESLPQNKDGLLARIRASHAALVQAISGLSEAELSAPGPEGWSVKDNIAHVANGERMFLRYYIEGKSWPEALDIDADTFDAVMTEQIDYNDLTYRRDKDRAVADVLAEFRQTHAVFMSALERLDAAAMLIPITPDRPESRLLDKVKGYCYVHYDEHATTIRAMRAS